MGESDAFEAYARHVNPALGRFLRVAGRDFRFVRAEGCSLWTDEGQVFSDWVSGFGTLNFGHHPEFAESALRQAIDSRAPHLYSESLNPHAGELARELARAAGPSFETCFFTNGGSEAVEAALKAAVAATGRSKILYLSGGYHGATLGALGCMASGLYREPFEALIPPVYQPVDFEDLSGLRRQLATREFAAFILEPIQMEGGARIVSPQYLASARRWCDEFGSLLVFDEIQTGLGRTGRLFAFQQVGTRPDIFMLGKALGAGLVPISAAVFGSSIWERAYGSARRSEIHGSTLGGNRLACSVALAVLRRLTEPGFLQGVEQRSATLARGLSRLREARRSVARVSLCGLIGGIQLRGAAHPWATWSGLGMPELEPLPSSGALLVQRLQKKGIWAQVCGHDWSVLRLEPPLTIDVQDIESFLAALEEGLTWLEEDVIDG